MATAILDDWTEEKCLQLIREYRKRPVLWDTKDPFFFKKSLKPSAWKEIGAAINISADQCKHKMIILMSSFRREKAKIMHSLKNDPSQVYKSTWFAFKEMSFLLDKDTERKRQLNQDSDEIDEDDENSGSIKVTLLNYHVDTSAPPAKRARPSMAVKKEFSQRVSQTEQEQPPQPVMEPPQLQQMPPQLQQPGPSQTLAERDEEIKSFTSFIGNKMKRYTDTTKNAVQEAICKIIFKADQNYYENNCYEKFTIIDGEPDPLHKEIYDHDSTVIKIQNDTDSD